VELCGHATLASAHILWQTEVVPIGQIIRFHTRSGLLEAMEKGNWIELNFSNSAHSSGGEFEGISNALGAVPDETYQSEGNLLYVYEDEANGPQARPDFSTLKHF